MNKLELLNYDPFIDACVLIINEVVNFSDVEYSLLIIWIISEGVSIFNFF
jgi:hypothetical protein